VPLTFTHEEATARMPRVGGFSLCGCLRRLFHASSPIGASLFRDYPPCTDLHETGPLTSTPQQIEISATKIVPPAEFVNAIGVFFLIHVRLAT
jgi:hypothetical protein